MGDNNQDIAQLPEDGQKALLFYAATEGRADVIQRVLSGNSELKSLVDDEGCSPLHRAVAIGKVDAVRSLLRNGCPVDTIATSGPHSGKTAPQLTTDPAMRTTFCAELLQSVMLEDEERTSELLRAGVSPQERVGPGKNDQTILAFVEELQASGNGASTNKAIPLLRNWEASLKTNKERKKSSSVNQTPEKKHHVSSSVNSSSHGAATDKDSLSGVANHSTETYQEATHPSSDGPMKRSSLSQSSLSHGSEDEEWSETTGPFSTVALQYPLLWPPPKHCRPLPGGDCLLGREAVAWLPEGAPVEVAGVRSAAWIKLSSTLLSKGVTLTPTRGGGNKASNTLTQRTSSMDAHDGTGPTESRGLALVLNASVLPHPSSFRLTVCAQGVALIAADPEGLLFGTFCLCQLIEFYSSESTNGLGGVIMPAVCIEDYPDFTRRGVIIDGRFPHTPRKRRLKLLVEQLASWRVNTVHLVLDTTPPPASTGPFKQKSKQTLKGSVVKIEPESEAIDLLEFDALCQHYFITLIPAWVPHVGQTTCPLDRFRQLSCRQLSLIFSQSNEPNNNITEKQVVGLLESLVEQGHFDTVHLWGLPPATLAAVANDPLRWMPLVLTAVHDFPSGVGTASGTRSSPNPTQQGAAISKSVKGGVGGMFGPALRSAPLLCSLVEAALTGLQEGACGMIIQGLPWENPLYPICLQELCFFAGAGVAWERNTASVCLGISPSSSKKGILSDLVRHHLYSGADNKPSDVETFVAVACCGPDEVRRCWQARRRVGSRFDLLDEPLWQLHTVDAFLPPHLLEHSAVVVNSVNQSDKDSSSGKNKPREAALLDIGTTFKELLRVMRAHEWSRQDGLRWMDPDAYAQSVNQATAVQRSLDSIHLTVDLLKLSCRLLQQLLLAVEYPSKTASGKQTSPTVPELMARIPAPTRSDLANKLLDLYQRLAVLWSRDFASSGLPVAFKQPPELLRLLTRDLPNFQIDEIYERIFAAKRL